MSLLLLLYFLVFMAFLVVSLTCSCFLFFLLFPTRVPCFRSCFIVFLLSLSEFALSFQRFVFYFLSFGYSKDFNVFFFFVSFISHRQRSKQDYNVSFFPSFISVFSFFFFLSKLIVHDITTFLFSLSFLLECCSIIYFLLLSQSVKPFSFFFSSL